MTGSKRAFVTTGATIPFRELIESCLDPTTLALLASQGYCSLVIQYAQAPSDIVSKCSGTRNGIKISGFNLKPDLTEDINTSDLVISHAGEYPALLLALG